MCCRGCSVTQRKSWIYGTGSFFAIIGTILVIFWANWAGKIVENSLILKEGSDTYNNWITDPIPIYLKFYMFNWTNPDKAKNPHVKPHFTEMGPYVFLEKRSKENITFYSNDTVYYYQRKTWYFQPHLSNGSLDDIVTTVHAVTVGVADQMRNSNKLVKKIINFILNHEGGKLYTTQRVSDWIFTGYDDKLLDFLKHFNTSKIDIPYKKFAWMVDRNNSLTYDGSFTINTGASDISKLGQIINWNNRNETGFYPPPCGSLNGTTGDVFPPHMDTDQDITLFITDACRYINLQPGGKTEKYGLEATEWVGTNKTFANHKCFCDPAVEECPKAGVIECDKCHNNAPIYGSYPHFYLADKSYLNAVDGLKPNPDKHKFVLAIEPIVGIPVTIEARLQLNMQIKADNDLDIFHGINEFLIPLFWFDQSAQLTPELARRAKLAINLEDYGRYFGIAFLCLGASFFATAIGLTLTNRWKWNQEEDEEILTNSN